MLLAITHNPYSQEPTELWDLLGKDEKSEYLDTKLDKVGFSNLKNKLTGSRGFIVK